VNTGLKDESVIMGTIAELNGQGIYFEDSGGSGRPIILAHGFLMDGRMFEPQVATLAPEFRVIRWDARGFGRTRCSCAPTPERWARSKGPQ